MKGIGMVMFHTELETETLRHHLLGKFEKGWYKVVLPSYKLISKHHYQEIYHYHEHEPELP